MTDQPKDGGAAFASMAVTPSGDVYQIDGMSLRDWFAGQALVGLLAGNYRQGNHHNLGEVPAEAYRIADAMLAARGQP